MYVISFFRQVVIRSGSTNGEYNVTQARSMKQRWQCIVNYWTLLLQDTAEHWDTGTVVAGHVVAGGGCNGGHQYDNMTLNRHMNLNLQELGDMPSPS